MDYTDLVYFGEREVWDPRPPRDLERWINGLLLLPSPTPYVRSAMRTIIDLCRHAQCSWNLECDAADYTDLLLFGERPLWVPTSSIESSAKSLGKAKSTVLLIECQCCFSDHDITSMACCPADHFFCEQCFVKYVSTQLGGGNCDLCCMETSGCNLPFEASQRGRFLEPKLIGLHSRLVQRRELKAANLEDFEECPFCDWGCIMEVHVDREPLLRCLNWENGCGVVSCRKCKKKSHGPKPCEEDEAKKEIRLVVEEAMSKALVRNCPNCDKAFIKTDGCNKMTCPQCKTASCYVCRQVVQGGYDHFYHNALGRNGAPSTNTKCLMYEPIPLEEQHAHDVQRAYEAASSQHPLAHPSTMN